MGHGLGIRISGRRALHSARSLWKHQWILAIVNIKSFNTSIPIPVPNLYTNNWSPGNWTRTIELKLVKLESRGCGPMLHGYLSRTRVWQYSWMISCKESDFQWFLQASTKIHTLWLTASSSCHYRTASCVQRHVNQKMEHTQLEHIDILWKGKLSLIYQPVSLSAKFHINRCTSNVATFNLLGFLKMWKIYDSKMLLRAFHCLLHTWKSHNHGNDH